MPTTIKQALKKWEEATQRKAAESKEIKLGNVAQPLRVALTGTTVSPGIDETIDLLGADEVRTRIARCIEQVSALEA